VSWPFVLIFFVTINMLKLSLHKHFHRAIEKKTYKKYIFDKTACQTNSVPRRLKCLRQTFLSYWYRLLIHYCYFFLCFISSQSAICINTKGKFVANISTSLGQNLFDRLFYQKYIFYTSFSLLHGGNVCVYRHNTLRCQKYVNFSKNPYINQPKPYFFNKLLWSHFWIDFNKFYTKTFGIVNMLSVYLLIMLLWVIFICT
jgi:hypothetical protein